MGGPPGDRQILLHTCCGPCAIVPHRELVGEGFEPTAFFANPNIQPSREYRKRLGTLEEYASRSGLPLVTEESYRPEDHLRATLDLIDGGKGTASRRARCRSCYDLRLSRAADEAARLGFGAFTTTLLVSPYQFHDEVKAAGEAAARRTGGQVSFVYRDFRPGWKDGARASREMGLYRQPYCGCLWSEVERYEPSRS